ncbi:Taurine catabolism dioxygenase TauD, TfdA family [Roseovarius albus]|uniref:Taurine catabolism dioxygenase TauD, TfdA family n=1 Tax=Roseovarius albus TaxID=1247867 RepID=A0A1X6ZSL1_9RHOB|nr:TauD/TfdA family dioxygenase [Roseovarius albus]SLN60032.1 Taurine catabolism dioxygenase TauD, TfdA family [Roseovarius albus]
MKTVLEVSPGFETVLDAPNPENEKILDDLARRLVEAPHFVVLRGFPQTDSPDAGTALAKAMARRLPHKEGVKPDMIERVSCTRVAIKEGIDPIGNNATAYSRTNQKIPLHTDSSYRASPHEFVAFQMIRPDAEGGETTLATVEDVINALDDFTQEVLSFPIYPFGKLRVPILWETASGPHIRYYRSQLDMDLEEADPPLPEPALAAVRRLDAVLENDSLQHRIKLEAGDVICLHNTKILHGRSAFAQTSDRLMFRLRADVGCIG